MQIFAEFFFDMLQERAEPLVFVFEGVKAMLRLKEYRELVTNEKIKTYVDFDTYKNLKGAQEHEDSLCKMTRSSRVIKKPKEVVVS